MIIWNSYILYPLSMIDYWRYIAQNFKIAMKINIIIYCKSDNFFQVIAYRDLLLKAMLRNTVWLKKKVLWSYFMQKLFLLWFNFFICNGPLKSFIYEGHFFKLLLILINAYFCKYMFTFSTMSTKSNSIIMCF